MTKDINTIDVIIPVYNGEKFIREAINSVLEQTISPDHIFIIDDGSTDNTEKIIKEYVSKYSGKIIYHLKKNGGPSSARNIGLSLSKSYFVAFLDSDDIWVKDKLEKQLSIFNNTNYLNLGLVYCNANIQDSNKSNIHYPAPEIDRSVKGIVFLKMLIANKTVSSASGVLIKKEVFNKVGIFDESLSFVEDWDMWLRIAEKYEMDFVDERLVNIRRHDNNRTVSIGKSLIGEIDFYNKWIENIKDKNIIPQKWADAVAICLILNFPNVKKIIKILKKIPQKTRSVLFRKTFGSVFIYCIYFCIHKLFNLNEWGRIYKYLKNKIKYD